MTKASEFRELDDEELETRLVDAKAELFNLRFQHVTGQQDNYARLGQVRRDIARMATLLREREIEAAEALETAPVMATTAAAPAPAATAATQEEATNE